MRTDDDAHCHKSLLGDFYKWLKSQVLNCREDIGEKQGRNGEKGTLVGTPLSSQR